MPKKFEYEYFDGCEWSYMAVVVIAEDRESAEKLIREKCVVSEKPYKTEKMDSLRYMSKEELPSLPYIVSKRLVD
jgi:hypothetical protein